MTRSPKTMIAVIVIILLLPFSLAWPGEQPVAIFHAFNQAYPEVESFVCDLAGQGYSHVQISPVQKSNPSPDWWARYQPVDYSIIEGRGSEADLKSLIDRAHGCNVKVIADVVFNHMANMPEFADLHFPQFEPRHFHPRCDINYEDNNNTSELDCWLGGLPDLNQDDSEVRQVHFAHIDKLLDLGIDGFRFDAAKHIPSARLKQYLDHIDQRSQGHTWNYLEVITDHDTKPNFYTWVGAISDFILYKTMKDAFTFGGDLRSLRVPNAIDDSRSVTFGRNHDNIREISAGAINAYDDPTDSYFATAYVLARESGTPLVLNWDNADAPFIPAGAKFRRIMHARGNEGTNVKENVLAVVDSSNVLMMERGGEGFFVVNKGTDKFDIPVLDLTLSNLEGCYQELRNKFTVAVERRENGKKYMTRWGTWNRGGMEVYGRDALYFVREPWENCR